MARRTFGTKTRKKPKQKKRGAPGRPADRGEALIKLLTKQPGLTPSQVARMAGWDTTRQNVWNIAKRQGIRMAGGRQKWATGL